MGWSVPSLCASKSSQVHNKDQLSQAALREKTHWAQIQMFAAVAEPGDSVLVRSGLFACRCLKLRTLGGMGCRREGKTRWCEMQDGRERTTDGDRSPLTWAWEGNLCYLGKLGSRFQWLVCELTTVYFALAISWSEIFLVSDLLLSCDTHSSACVYEITATAKWRLFLNPQGFVLDSSLLLFMSLLWTTEWLFCRNPIVLSKIL